MWIDRCKQTRADAEKTIAQVVKNARVYCENEV